MIKCCIFDLDGTVFDTLTSIRHFLNVILEKYGVLPITVEECRYFVGNGAKTLVKRSLLSKGIDDSELLEKIAPEYIKLYDENATYLTAPYDGITDMLEGLKAVGITLAILSNKPDPTVKQLAEKLTPGVFKIAMGGREGIPLKPDPTAVYEILDELGVTPSEVVYVGDTSVDMETGKNFGAAYTVGVPWGFRDRAELEQAGADMIVDTPSEILALVKRVNK